MTRLRLVFGIELVSDESEPPSTEAITVPTDDEPSRVAPRPGLAKTGSRPGQLIQLFTKRSA